LALISEHEDSTNEAFWAWAKAYIETSRSGTAPKAEQKTFKPKCPELAKQWNYKKLPDNFWNQFPVNVKEQATPNISWEKIKLLADSVGNIDRQRLDRVIDRLKHGAKIGCSGAARQPSRSNNSRDAYINGQRVTDAIAAWVKTGYVRGPILPADVPQDVKINGIMTRSKPDGSVRVILNLSAPAGISVNDGINNDDFPTKMSSTTSWLGVLNQAGAGCWISKTDWADAYKQFPVHREDLPLQWFEWGGRYFVELCLIFGGVSSAGIFDDGAKLYVDISCNMAKFPQTNVCQHLDDICAAAAANSDALHRLEDAFQKVAEFTGIRLAPKDNPEKAFPPSKQGVVFGIAYNTEDWSWHVPNDKMARIHQQIKAATATDETHEKEVKSLVGKLIHIKALMPSARFNMDHIMKWLADSNNMDIVPTSTACKQQLQFWADLLLTCNGYMKIPEMPTHIPPDALNVYCDAAGGSLEGLGRGSGSVCGPLWVYVQWPSSINTGQAKWEDKKVGRKLTALELLGPLCFAAAAPDALRRRTAVFWIDNAGSVAVWEKGYSPHCSMSNCIIKATASVCAAIGCEAIFKKITRCSNTGSVLADALSKAEFTSFFATADRDGWGLCQEPLKVPSTITTWINNPHNDQDLGLKLVKQLALTTAIIGNPF